MIIVLLSFSTGFKRFEPNLNNVGMQEVKSFINVKGLHNKVEMLLVFLLELLNSVLDTCCLQPLICKLYTNVTFAEETLLLTLKSGDYVLWYDHIYIHAHALSKSAMLL